MLAENMATPRDIDKAAKCFFQSIRDAMARLPNDYEKDKEMAKAAGVHPTTFSEYKTGAKGITRPNFYVVYKIAYILAHGPPCSLEPDTILFNRLKEALKKDHFHIIDKIITLILTEADLSYIAANVNLTFEQIFPPQASSQDS